MPFIVIEGLDGAGKSTQIENIKGFLEQGGRKYEYIHFPRFDTPVYGELIAKFLRGELGTVESVDPHLVALMYASDRRKAAPMIKEWLKEGKYVIIDRYVTSNIAYQCAKIEDSGEKDKLREWILNLEYNDNNIPRPDVTLFLNVPFKFTESKLTKTRTGDDRDYLKGGKDIHEASLSLQRKVREMYLGEAGHDKTFHIVDCSDGKGEMLEQGEVFSKIRDIIKNLA